MENELITAVIVIYNRKVEESITCQRIKDIDSSIDVLVLDNSEIITGNQEYCTKNGIRYISMEGNKGLSKAYNKAIDHSELSDVVVFFDDDTEITRDYFQKLKIALSEHPEIDIFAPIIRGQDGVIYSPNEFNFLRNHLVASSNLVVSQKAFNAIASCLAVRRRVFKNYRFNETLFVDQVDQYFFCEQRKLGRKFGVLNVEILQHFYQRGATLSPEEGWRRLRGRILDIFRHARLMGGGRYIVLALIKCCGLGVQIGIKSKCVLTTIRACLMSFMLVMKAR